MLVVSRGAARLARMGAAFLAAPRERLPADAPRSRRQTLYATQWFSQEAGTAQALRVTVWLAIAGLVYGPVHETQRVHGARNG